ncbi:MAG: nuclear transport factor 2 family protein [Thermoleophilia bacterium]
MPADRTARVHAAYDAFAAADRDAIEELLAPAFTFHAPPDPDLDRDGFFERCWPGAGRAVAGFAFTRLTEIGGDEVVATYEAMRPDGTRFRNTEIFAFDGDRILRQEVYFGWELPGDST